MLDISRSKFEGESVEALILDSFEEAEFVEAKRRPPRWVSNNVSSTLSNS